jgi:REP element-mobilizing transposase RayT
MPRSRLILSSELPYHVSARCNNREAFPASLPFAWEVLGELLWESQITHGSVIHAFVLMPNHFHLLVTAAGAPLPKVMQFLMVEATRRIHRRVGKCGHLFQGPHHRSLIQDTVYYRQALKYVLRNPVKAGLSARAEDWTFSSLQFILGQARPRFSISPPLLPLDINLSEVVEEQTLEWINRDYREAETEKWIRSGLKRRVFTSLRDRKTRDPLESKLREDFPR